jgi:hypothetical protein
MPADWPDSRVCAPAAQSNVAAINSEVAVRGGLDRRGAASVEGTYMARGSPRTVLRAIGSGLHFGRVEPPIKAAL